MGISSSLQDRWSTGKGRDEPRQGNSSSLKVHVIVCLCVSVYSSSLPNHRSTDMTVTHGRRIDRTSPIRCRRSALTSDELGLKDFVKFPLQFNIHSAVSGDRTLRGDPTAQLHVKAVTF
jgi:hypothetical protein